MPCRTPAPSPRQPPPSIAAAGSYRHQAAPPEVPDFTGGVAAREDRVARHERVRRSEEHTSELQSPCNLVCRLLLEKKKSRCLCRAGGRDRHARRAGRETHLGAAWP